MLMESSYSCFNYFHLGTSRHVLGILQVLGADWEGKKITLIALGICCAQRPDWAKKNCSSAVVLAALTTRLWAYLMLETFGQFVEGLIGPGGLLFGVSHLFAVTCFNFMCGGWKRTKTWTCIERKRDRYLHQAWFFCLIVPIEDHLDFSITCTKLPTQTVDLLDHLLEVS